MVVGWGSTYGAIHGAVRRARADGRRVSHLHLRYLNPLPDDLGEILSRYDRVLVPEVNMGQLSFVLRGRYLCDVIPLNKIKGQPFMTSELLEAILEQTETA